MWRNALETTNILFRRHMGPRQLFLEFVSLMPLLSGFRRLLEAGVNLLIVCLEVWDCFLLADKHLGCLGNIL